jgi:hypothetical protein
MADQIEPFREVIELVLGDNPEFRSELQSLAVESLNNSEQPDGRQAAGERLRERCESHAGLDINGCRRRLKTGPPVPV